MIVSISQKRESSQIKITSVLEGIIEPIVLHIELAEH